MSSMTSLLISAHFWSIDLPSRLMTWFICLNVIDGLLEVFDFLQVVCILRVITVLLFSTSVNRSRICPRMVAWLAKRTSWTKLRPILQFGGRLPVAAYLRDSITVVLPAPFGPRISVRGKNLISWQVSGSKLRTPWMLSFWRCAIVGGERAVNALYQVTWWWQLTVIDNCRQDDWRASCLGESKQIACCFRNENVFSVSIHFCVMAQLSATVCWKKRSASPMTKAAAICLSLCPFTTVARVWTLFISSFV